MRAQFELLFGLLATQSGASSSSSSHVRGHANRDGERAQEKADKALLSVPVKSPLYQQMENGFISRSGLLRSLAGSSQKDRYKKSQQKNYGIFNFLTFFPRNFQNISSTDTLFQTKF